MNRIFSCSFLILFLYFQPASADMNAANDALARGDHAAAAAEFEKLAEQGDKKAQAHLGYMYYVGEGVEQDYVKAVKWYKKAAILGDKDSQYNLAVAYAFGEGAKQDYKEAFHWYRRAAEQNHAVAQYSLGVSYAYGEGIPQDPKIAAEWFQKSADQGYERAQVLLGSLYHTGDGVEKDYEKAALWYRKAADKGNAAAQYNLGTLYRAGNGVEQDYNQAVRWFRLSADQGYAAAQNELSSIERAVAGANRPAPVSVPEIESIPEQVETTPVKTEEKPSESIPALAKTEDVVTDPVEPAEEVAPTVAPVEETVVADTPQEEPKPGFFSKLFGKKDTSNAEPEQSGVVYASPEEIAAAETKFVPAPAPEPEPVTPEVIASPKPEISEPEVAEVTSVPEPEDDEVIAVEEEPKPGFFSKLFGEKDTSSAEPEQSGVVYASPEEIAAAETKFVPAPEPEAVTPEVIASPEPEISQPEVAEVASVPEPKADEVITVEEEPKPGFFAKLFGKKDTSDAEPEQSGVVYASPEESSEVVTYAADSAPAGQQLESSPETQITDEIVTESPAEVPAEDITSSEIVLAEPASVSEDSTMSSIEEIPEEEAPKKGFFSRLFGSKDTSNVEENKDATESIETDEPIEPIVIAKLEEPDQVDAMPEGTEDVSIDDIDVSYDLESIGSASEIQPLAVKGDSKAQFQLGTLYYSGKGVKQDYSQAFLWYRRAAQQGESDAQYSLANMYLMGEGIKQDDYQARQWYEKAAEQGHEGAQHNLKSLQRIATAEPAPDIDYDPDNNILPEQSEEIAEEETSEKKGFFSKLFGKDDADEEEVDESEVSADEIDELETSSEQLSADSSDAIDNSPSSIYEKGLAFEFGEGVAQSYDTAFEFFKKSAEQNYAPAQYKLGLAYAYGQGTEKDPEIATEWYKKSAAQGYALAQRTLATNYMSGDGIEQNKSLALAWYDILADSGNVMDVHRRDSLKEKLTPEEIEEANNLKQQLSN